MLLQKQTDSISKRSLRLTSSENMPTMLTGRPGLVALVEFSLALRWEGKQHIRNLN